MNLYVDIRNAIRQLDKTLWVDGTIHEPEVRHAIRWVLRDNPDIFWFAHQYHYDKANSTIHFQYTFSEERVKTIQQSINDVIDNDFCIEYVKKLNQQEQVAYIYKWLVTYCTYNTNSAYNQSIYSVFVRRNSVCTGYAKAAQHLFNLLGIESQLVFGRLHNDKEDGRHCWNLVKVNNEYFHFDACFGDSILDNVAFQSGVQELFKIDDINYNFLCTSTDEMLKTRSIEDIETLPECPISWSRNLIISLARTEIKNREKIKGCLLSHIGSSADIYLCTKDKNTILKVFRPNCKTTSREEFHYMQQLKGCHHLLQYNEDYTDIAQNTVAIEQSTPIVDLLCSHYYELSLKGLIKMATDVALAWKECQERGVLYRDIHVCNIYRSDDGTFKLGDFGSCTNKFDLKETVGNQWFMAPETFVSGIFTESSAVYSISMVMYFILNNLRPAFWKPGCEDEALRTRMNGCELPTPIGCINIPPHLKTKLDNFFRSTSASLPKERISSIEEFIYELEKLTSYCGDPDYVIHRKGISLTFDLDAGNSHRLDERWNYIPPYARHRYAMGDEVEQMCTTAILGPTYDCTLDVVSDDGGRSVDQVEDFAITRGYYSGECDCIEKNFTYESVCPLKTSPDEASLKNLKIAYEKTIKCLTQEQEQLKSVHSQIDKLKKKKDQVEAQMKKSSLVSAAEGGLASLLGRFLIIPGMFAAYPVASSNESTDANQEVLLECDKELKTKMSLAQMSEKRIDGFLQQKNNLEKELANLEEQNRYNEVYSSIFAPAEVKRKSHLQVQVYLHLSEEIQKVKSLAKESDKNAKRRGYIPLSFKLRKGDNVDVEFNVNGETRLISERKSVIWQGSFTKCSFDYFVPKDIDVYDLSCVVSLSANRIPLGEMRFITKIVDSPRQLNPEINAHKYNKVFISYSHLDESKVRYLHEGLQLGSVPHFFDRKSLKAGDVFPQVIKDYIDSADLFILCWSENASKSEYVRKERLQALERAFPQIKPEQDAKLRIYPISIEPRADLPSDMKGVYNFEEI